MPVSRSCSQLEISNFQFRWIQAGIKYLELKLTADSDIIEINLMPLLQEIKNNFERWKIINLTMWGKINTIKMVIVPQFNYTPMMLPVIIPSGIYKQHNQIVKDYLWKGKKPRINIKKLCTTGSPVG